MKTIKILIFVFLWLFAINNSYWDIWYCDNANINKTWYNFEEICNWSKIIDIADKKSFFSKYSQLKLWFFWSNLKKSTNDKNFNFSIPVWFLWTSQNKIDKGKKLSFIIPVWFITDFNLENSKLWFRGELIENKSSYRDYYKSILKILTKEKFSKLNYNHSEYETFISNLAEYSFYKNSSYLKNTIIDKNFNDNIKVHMETTNFENNLNKLIINLSKINNTFSKITDNKKRWYILKYYLNK